MKFKGEINSLFGDSFTHDLRGLIEKSAVEKENIKSLAHDMGVSTAYTANKDKDPFNGVDTMEQMLDEWYQKKLCQLSQEEAWNLLIKVFEENCSALVLHTIRKGKPSTNTGAPPSSSRPPAADGQPQVRQEASGENSKMVIQSGSGTMNVHFHSS